MQSQKARSYLHDLEHVSDASGEARTVIPYMVGSGGRRRHRPVPYSRFEECCAREGDSRLDSIVRMLVVPDALCLCESDSVL